MQYNRCMWLVTKGVYGTCPRSRTYSNCRNNRIAKFARISAEKSVFPNLEFLHHVGKSSRDLFRSQVQMTRMANTSVTWSSMLGDIIR
jgi:hypothetical protein